MGCFEGIQRKGKLAGGSANILWKDQIVRIRGKVGGSFRIHGRVKQNI